MWETLAILEYLAEKFPDAALAGGSQARAQRARISSEMHAGFLRAAQAMPDEYAAAGASERALSARRRRTSRESRRCGATAARVGATGEPFLFGKFSAADAMYAPVVCAPAHLRRQGRTEASRVHGGR